MRWVKVGNPTLSRPLTQVSSVKFRAAYRLPSVRVSQRARYGRQARHPINIDNPIGVKEYAAAPASKLRQCYERITTTIDRDTGRNLQWVHLKKQETPWLKRPGTEPSHLRHLAERDQCTCIWTTSLALSIPLCCFQLLWVAGPAGPSSQACSQPERETR